ncbi:hypothetical protein EHEL_021350 [Encephalitozoon hellem ATCC 50504]|uniref:Exosome complex exonuclease Rrp41 n=1 Tax=Encephalitozoon hellem TaxID=27973 RepID=A0A9Q9F7T9_ENCHE|nr:uncharacterized protein EHEL_021350 [Encephalitozoon hellem ATCC 50504]AFM97889.1 hypothetical protein EHEL_021350 [Encephalitozoon hellem ATCC 50504]UTX42668.1 exosome complex exonuclease Rrp46 [Encephalitozoon hellem]WEL38125.1 exosome complex exonuclease Rrp41 [Encephalitozoon hellem]|eukprot:XP_003886870.1 hypothetical protein EHEL_021350 [Encephalitozoon hellem ATCC 50504]
MEIKTGMVEKALSSCYLKTNKTSVICSIHFEQKGETDSWVEVNFSDVLPLKVCSPIVSIADSLLSSKSRSTKIKVSFHAVKYGEDLFSCLVNSFSMCVILSGIRVVDTICSGTVYAGKDGISLAGGPDLLPLHMVYVIHRKRIMQVHFDGILDSTLLADATEKLVHRCIEQSVLMKSKVEDVVNDIVNG